MSKLVLNITMSLDGYVAGPNQTTEEPLGVGGEDLHEWIFGLKGWREAHGLEGGETGVDSDLANEMQDHGAVIMGRKMFGGGPGPWNEAEPWNGWWGEDPPYNGPVFVITHHPRERVEMANGKSYTFVTDGIESALEQARAAAGEKKIHLAGGAGVANQYLAAGLLDQIDLHIAPRFLGGGERLFAGLTSPLPKLEQIRAVSASNNVTHITYRVVS